MFTFPFALVIGIGAGLIVGVLWTDRIARNRAARSSPCTKDPLATNPKRIA